jgi:hypothetical protein
MLLEIIRAVIFGTGWIAFDLLSGLCISRVALLPILGTDKREIALSVSATFLAAVLCFSLLIVYGGVIVAITGESRSVPCYSTGSFYPGPSYDVYEKMYTNRDAVAAEMWKRLTLPRSQGHCFTPNTTVCNLADQVESERPGLTRNTLWSIALFALSAALTCIRMTMHFLIRKQAAAIKKTPGQLLNYDQLLTYIRLEKTYPVITLILILYLSTGLCLCYFVIIPILWPGPAQGSATTELPISNNEEYCVCFTDAKGLHKPYFCCPCAPWMDPNAFVVMSKKAIWIGPWRSTLAPGIIVGLCIIAAIELVLLGVFKIRSAGQTAP